MDYHSLIADLLATDKIIKNSQLYSDYILLIDMKNSGVINMFTINNIYSKYKNEINEIDNYRKMINNGNVVCYDINDNNITTLNVLINHLFSIMCLRCLKDIVDDEIRKKIVSNDEKVIYNLLVYLRDNKK